GVRRGMAYPSRPFRPCRDRRASRARRGSCLDHQGQKGPLHAMGPLTDRWRLKVCCRRIFVVDDHPIILSGVGAMINSQADLTIVGLAANADEALEGIGRALPDVAVVDISLPGINGVTLIERLVERFPEIGCIALTAHEDPGCLRQVLAAG